MKSLLFVVMFLVCYSVFSQKRTKAWNPNSGRFEKADFCGSSSGTYDGYASGRGVMVFNDGTKFSGQFSCGLPMDEMRLSTSSGVYVQLWQQNADFPYNRPCDSYSAHTYGPTLRIYPSCIRTGDGKKCRYVVDEWYGNSITKLTGRFAAYDNKGRLIGLYDNNLNPVSVNYGLDFLSGAVAAMGVSVAALTAISSVTTESGLLLIIFIY